MKSSLRVERKNIFDEIEYEIPFDNIGNKLQVQTIVNNNVIIIGIFFFVFSFLFLLGNSEQLTFIFGTFGILFMVAPFINRKKVITITSFSDNNLELYFTNQNKDEVKGYANEIISAANNYLLKKYGRVDKSLPANPQLENYYFLLNREIIDEETYEKLKSNLLGTDNKNSIGFSPA